jgi:hypothetical protein
MWRKTGKFTEKWALLQKPLLRQIPHLEVPAHPGRLKWNLSSSRKSIKMPAFYGLL